MNGTKAKFIRRRAKAIRLNWLRGLLDPEESKGINLDNIEDYMPEDKYFFAQGSRRNYIMSQKWVEKQLKKGLSVAEVMEVAAKG